MNAKPGQSIVIDKAELRRLLWIQDLKGLAAAALILAGFILWWPPIKEPDYPTITRDANLDAIYTYCLWPQSEGEMTVVAVLDGKRTCWRWK